MDVSIVSLFPEFFESPFSTALLGRAIESSILNISIYNPRDNALDARKTVDDVPYGGGVGMVLTLAPLVATLDAIPKKGKILMLSPSGKRFTQEYAKSLSQEEAITFICGRYEGIDARIQQKYEIEEVSIGDFILSGGEVATVAMVESIGRLLPNFMGKEESAEEESFSAGLLEYPHYTRPSSFEGHRVPEVLLSGNHRAIACWRREQSLLKTLQYRPELLKETLLTKEDMAFLQENSIKRNASNIYVALVHYPVLGKDKKSIAVSLTNLDIHDIARCTCTYGLGGYYVTTPLEEQKKLFSNVVSHWRDGAGACSNTARSLAMKNVYCLDTIEDVVQNITQLVGSVPAVIATSASSVATTTCSAVRELALEQAVLLLFGTSHGLAPEVFSIVDDILPPIRWIGGYNHLSVRSAVSITIDRILGDFS